MAFIEHRIRIFAFSSALLCAVAACSKTSDAPPPVASGPTLPDGRVPAALVQALDTNTMMAMEQRSGSWQEADANSTFRAMASGGTVRVIDETMRVGESSSRRVTHYYTTDGVPAAIYEFRIQTVTAGDRPPTKQFVLFKLELVGDSVTFSQKTVDGTAQTIEPFEVENARKHSMALFDAAKTAPVISPAKP